MSAAAPVRMGLKYSLVIVASLTTMLSSLTGLASPEQAAAASLPGPFATILFSRTEITAADNCVPRDTNIARLDTAVAPYLKSLGLTATGTLTPDRISQSTRRCVHYNDTMMGSWADAQSLSANFGWTFVSHTADLPLSSGRSHGCPVGRGDLRQRQLHRRARATGRPRLHRLPGHSRGCQLPSRADYGSKCFAWGRQYGGSGLTLVHLRHDRAVLATHACGQRRRLRHDRAAMRQDRHAERFHQVHRCPAS